MTGVDDCAYPTVHLDTTADWLSITPPDNTLFCIMAETPGTSWFNITVVGEPEPGASAELAMRVTRLHCEDEESDVECPSYTPASYTVTLPE